MLTSASRLHSIPSLIADWLFTRGLHTTESQAECVRALKQNTEI